VYLPYLNQTRTRRSVIGELMALAAVASLAAIAPRPAAAQQGVTTPDGRYYDAYIPAATKEGQWYQYSCEFDASWAVLATFGFDVTFEEQLAIVGHDTSIEPYYESTADGFVVYGGDITSAYSGDYTSNLLARTTGKAMLPLFQHYGLEAAPVDSREGIVATLNGGGLVWMKATVDFLGWEPVTWITPQGASLPGVLGNDHALVVMGYNDYGVVIRDVLGPTSSNWERVYEYDVAWETFLPVFAAQGNDGIGVFPPGAAAASEDAPAAEPASDIIQPSAPKQICC